MHKVAIENAQVNQKVTSGKLQPDGAEAEVAEGQSQKWSRQAAVALASGATGQPGPGGG